MISFDTRCNTCGKESDDQIRDPLSQLICSVCYLKRLIQETKKSLAIRRLIFVEAAEAVAEKEQIIKALEVRLQEAEQKQTTKEAEEKQK